MKVSSVLLHGLFGAKSMLDSGCSALSCRSMPPDLEGLSQRVPRFAASAQSSALPASRPSDRRRTRRPPHRHQSFLRRRTAVVVCEHPLRCFYSSLRPAPVRQVGIDLNPLDAANPDDQLWLLAMVWAEHAERAILLRNALTMAAHRPPQVLAGDAFDRLPEVVESSPCLIAPGSTPSLARLAHGREIYRLTCLGWASADRAYNAKSAELCSFMNASVTRYNFSQNTIGLTGPKNCILFKLKYQRRLRNRHGNENGRVSPPELFCKTSEWMAKRRLAATIGAESAASVMHDSGKRLLTYWVLAIEIRFAPCHHQERIPNFK